MQFGDREVAGKMPTAHMVIAYNGFPYGKRRYSMKIDLTNPTNFVLENVRALLASGDNDIDIQLRVTMDGIAFLSDITGPERRDGLLFRLETWDAEGNHVGPKAAADDEWVNRIYECLKKNWPNPEHTTIETY